MEQSVGEKLLGVVTDLNLSWDLHIDYLIKSWPLEYASSREQESIEQLNAEKFYLMPLLSQFLSTVAPFGAAVLLLTFKGFYNHKNDVRD